MASCTYRFIPSSLIDLPNSRSYELRVRQQPQRAKISVINERDRRPIEPPPILQVHWLDCSPDDIKKNLQCPFYFMVVNLLSAESDELLSTQDYLAGSTVSSLYRLRDVDDRDGGFFVFGDLYCKKQGHYRLQFNLFEIVEGDVQNRQIITSEPFQTYMPKLYPGPVEATFLSQTFSDQGVKMRIRKEHRANSGTARKRRLDVQALMESNQGSISFKTTKISLEAPHRLTASTGPPKIAPAAPHHQNLNQPQSKIYTEQQNLHYRSSENIYSYHDHQHHQQSAIFTKKATSIGTHHLPVKDHITATASHAYPSPPLLPANPSRSSSSSCSSSSTDDFPVTLLDEYHLQQQSCPSSASSFSSKTSSTSPRCLPDLDSPSHAYDNHLPSTPSSICFYPSDHSSPSLQHHAWGENLPALKAVMSGDTSRSASLRLPCPF
ncbi:velvet factor-domain-containing protein [Absidia repens]|uniref:Velvet factor-domain-containing protein n=1 Tax=Absidia repens TaxID=90262 RepID=A0A1X2ILM2_9FUNG|nr:velvet factor-domain-containing protein [Absidia repens]